MRSTIPRPITISLAVITAIVVGSWGVFSVWGLLSRTSDDPPPSSEVSPLEWRPRLADAAARFTAPKRDGEPICTVSDLASRDTDSGYEVYGWAICSVFEVETDRLKLVASNTTAAVFVFNPRNEVTKVETFDSGKPDYVDTLTDRVGEPTARRFLAPGSLQNIPDTPRINALEQYQLPLYFVDGTTPSTALDVVDTGSDGELKWDLLGSGTTSRPCVGIRLDLPDSETADSKLTQVEVCAEPKFKTGASKAVDVLNPDLRYGFTIGFAPGADTVRVNFVDGNNADVKVFDGVWGIVHGSHRTIHSIGGIRSGTETGGCGMPPFRSC